MSIKRLLTLSPRLVNLLQKMSADEQRTLRNLACTYAVQVADLQDQVALDTLDALDYGVPIDAVSKRHLEQLLDDLEARYFENSSQCSDGEDDGIEYFHKARAIAALIEAGKDNWHDSIFNSIYEAAMAASNQQELTSRLLAIAGH